LLQLTSRVAQANGKINCIEIPRFAITQENQPTSKQASKLDKLVADPGDPEEEDS